MDFQLSEEQTLIQDMAKNFAATELAPYSSKWDEEKFLDRDVFTKAAELGFLGIYTSEEHGGTAKAVREGDEYVLNGTKTFISGAGWSDIYVVMARTSDDGARGVSTFVIEKGTDGLSFGTTEKKMGWNAQPTAQVIMEDCRIPAGNRIGAEGDGFKFAMSGLDGGRINIGACSLGGAQKALDATLQYTKERSQFGKAISDFQNTQFMLADMATELEASRMMIYRAADMLDKKLPNAGAACAMAKRFSTDMCSKIANDALQLHGGYGYLSEYQIEQIVRDLRVHQIYRYSKPYITLIDGFVMGGGVGLSVHGRLRVAGNATKLSCWRCQCLCATRSA